MFIPWDQFERAEAIDKWVESIRKISVSGRFSDGKGGSVRIQKPRLARGDILAVSSRSRRGKAAEAGEPAVYNLQVQNSSNQKVQVAALKVDEGRKEMEVTIPTKNLVLSTGSTDTVEVRVTPTDRVPKGGFEAHKIRLLPNGNATAAVETELFTSRLLEEPSMVHDKEGWDNVRARCEKYDWAAEKRENKVEQAHKWNVPTTRSSGGIFHTKDAGRAYNAAIAWQLSRDKALAKKVATFLRRTADPETGYPEARKATRGALVQEGVFF